MCVSAGPCGADGGRRFHSFDVFGMIPPPTSEKDGPKSQARYAMIRAGRPGAGAGAGGRLRDPVAFCLGAIGDLMNPGGAILVDDYHDYGGARAAVDESSPRAASPAPILSSGSEAARHRARAAAELSESRGIPKGQ